MSVTRMVAAEYMSIALCLACYHVKGYVIGATGKPISASFSYGGFEPTKAVDGDKNTVFPNVFHSELGASQGWWQVDLQEEVVSPLVTIYFRSDYAKRRNGVRMSLSNNPSLTNSFCHIVQGSALGTDISQVYEIRCEDRGRYLTLSTVTDNDGEGPVLDFGEVEVYACSAMTFGPDCDQDCHCLNGTCDSDTGECFSGCLPGWTSTACDQLKSASDVSAFVKYLPLCQVQIAFNQETVSMATLTEMEVISMATRIECMHDCDALHLCSAFQFILPGNCSLWMTGSSVLTESRGMWKKQI